MQITFIINNLTHFHIINDYIKKLHEYGGYSLTTILVKPELFSKVDFLSSYSKVLLLFTEKSQSKKRKGSSNNTTSQNKPFYFFWLYFFYLFIKHYRIIKKSRQIYKQLKPDFVIISSDRYTDFDLFFSKECWKRKTPTAVVGIDFFYVDTYEAYYKSNSSRKISNFNQKLMAILFPKQVYPVRDFFCLYYPTHLMLNLWLMRALPFSPYLSGSRFVKQIHVDCEYTKAKYVEAGVDGKKIKVTGLLEHDLLAKSLEHKSALRAKFNCSESQQVILMGVPQGWEHNLVTKEEHFCLIREILKVVSNVSTKIILSLHPKMKREDYLFLETEFCVQISELPLRDIMCIADLYISTYSSTVLWSVLLQIPSIIFDVYQLNYQCYRNLPSVTLTHGIQEFQEALIFKINTLKEQQSSQIKTIKEKNPFGTLDGSAFKNFLSCIHESY